MKHFIASAFIKAAIPFVVAINMLTSDASALGIECRQPFYFDRTTCANNPYDRRAVFKQCTNVQLQTGVILPDTKKPHEVIVSKDEKSTTMTLDEILQEIERTKSNRTYSAEEMAARIRELTKGKQAIQFGPSNVWSKECRALS